MDRAHLGRAPWPAPAGLLLSAASFRPLLVGQIEPGTPALDPVGRTLDAMDSLSLRHVNRDVHGGTSGFGQKSFKGGFVFVCYKRGSVLGYQYIH